MSIITALLAIIFIVLIHELGHFVAAKREGIEVEEFSLFFGPLLYSFKRGETQYSLRLIPAGAFVRIAGMAQDEEPNPRAFNQKTPFQKIKVLFAGPAANLLLAVIVFIYTFTFVGMANPVQTPIIGDVLEGKAAYQAGLKPGDEVLAVDGVKVSTWTDFVTEIKKSTPKEPLPLKIKRNDQILTLTVRPEVDKTSRVTMIGVSQQVQFERVGVLEGLKLGFYQTFQIIWMILLGLGQLITGAASASDIAGPVGITKMIADAASGGMVYLVNFTALLSISLGIFNLLPIPALDGSRIVFAVIEGLRGRPVEPEKENFIHFIGFVLVMLLMVMVTYNDIVRLIRG